MLRLKNCVPSVRSAALLLLVGVSLSACATEEYVNERIAIVDARITEVDARVSVVDAKASDALQRADAANAAAQQANQRIDQMGARVNRYDETTTMKRPRG